MPIIVSMNPMLYTALDGKRYAVSGQHWVEVPMNTTLEGIDKYMVKLASETNDTKGKQNWKVEGSKGNKYTVSLIESQWSCTCVGYGWRSKCKHIQYVKDNIYNVGANGS